MGKPIEHLKRNSCLYESLGVDIDVIKLVSAQASFRLVGGISIVAPFSGRPFGLQVHHWHGLGRHAFPVQSSQDGFDCGRPMGVQNALFQSPVSQEFPGELDEIQRPQPFDAGLRLNSSTITWRSTS
jgi:hypothetical protein